MPPFRELRGTSLLFGLHKRLELMHISAAKKGVVGIVTLGQKNPTSRDAVRGKPMRQLFCSLSATLVGIIVESDIYDSRVVTRLAELIGVEMRAQGAGHVGEGTSCGVRE
jgi:hypothetical protein